MERMLKDEAAVFIDDKYDDHGKWMDGWESRRKRIPGNDWCIVKLAKPGVIHGVEIDTTHFTGNYPPAASIDVCRSEDHEPGSDAGWIELVSQSVLDGDSEHQYGVNNPGIFTHVRVNIYPDGGIARLRVYAEPRVDWEKVQTGERVDIAAALNGGVALACNNEHYGSIRYLLNPGRGVNMGDGWETRRRREPGNDWVVIALARPGCVREIKIDTAHYKGNYPDSCSISGAHLDLLDLASVESESEKWQELLPREKLQADHIHVFEDNIIDIGEVTHIRVNIYPDGGLSRVRVMAEVS
jgi:allantoicase